MRQHSLYRSEIGITKSTDGFAYPYFQFNATEDIVEDQDESSLTLRSSFANIIKLSHLFAL